MIYSTYLSLCLFGISVWLVADTVANEAIVDGIIATAHQFQYQVSLQLVGHMCGGGILSNLFILTAAHCVVQNDGNFIIGRFLVIAGTNDVDQDVDTAVNIDVKKMYVPAEYRRSSYYSTDDIALLKLRDALELHRHIFLKRLQLPSSNETYSDHIATIAGFGWTYLNATRIGPDHRLRFIEARVLSNNLCRQLYPSERVYIKHLCAQAIPHHLRKPRGVCIGDAGGPLVIGRVVVGILSKLPGDCDENRRAGIYTRVSNYLDFIDNAVHDRQLRSVRSQELPQFL